MDSSYNKHTALLLLPDQKLNAVKQTIFHTQPFRMRLSLPHFILSFSLTHPIQLCIEATAQIGDDNVLQED
jgi:hypothetical protein